MTAECDRCGREPTKLSKRWLGGDGLLDGLCLVCADLVHEG